MKKTIGVCDNCGAEKEIKEDKQYRGAIKNAPEEWLNINLSYALNFITVSDQKLLCPDCYTKLGVTPDWETDVPRKTLVDQLFETITEIVREEINEN